MAATADSNNLTDGYDATVRSSPALTVIIIVVNVVVITTAILGNFLTIFTICLSKNLHKTQFVFLASLSVADLILAPILLGSSSFNILHNSTKPEDEIICHVVLNVALTTGFCSVIHMGLIALNRLIAVKLPSHYNKIYTTAKVGAVLGFTWMAGVIFGLSPIFGLIKVKYDPRLFCCMADWAGSKNFTIVTFGIFPTITSITTILCYGLMLRHVHKSHKKMQQHSDRKRFLKRKDIQLILQLLAVFLLFLLCWGPYIVCILLDTMHLYVPADLVFTAGLLTASNSAYNPLIYFFWNKTFGQELKRLASKCFKRNTIHALQSADEST